jgi:TPR repeat protein
MVRYWHLQPEEVAMRFPSRFSQFSGVALSALIAVAGPMPAFAQGGAPAAPDASTPEASAPSPEALRERGEALVYGLGDVAQDLGAGMAALEQAATAGDARAQAALGKILLDGYYLPAEPERARAYLEQAAGAGNGAAQEALGSALLWGGALGRDPERARALLEAAASSGRSSAQALLGEQLLGGWVLPRDVEAGLPLLEQAIGAGDVKARLALGAFLLYGIALPADAPRALALFEEAAAAGNGTGLAQYGEALMWKLSDPPAAEAYLRRAGEMGVGAAWATLAEGAMYGYLGGGAASRAKFDDFAEKARAAGNARIAVLEAQRQMWGISMVASGPQTVAQLTEAAEAGNAEAAKFLIALLRDGNGLNVMKDAEAAEAALERYRAALSEAEIWQYGLTIAAKRARVPARYAALAEQAAAHPEWMSDWLGQELYKANPNVAVYLVQQKLRAAGSYRGALDGYVGPKTVRALKAACAGFADLPACDDSVLRPEVIGAVLAGG